MEMNVYVFFSCYYLKKELEAFRSVTTARRVQLCNNTVISCIDEIFFKKENP